MKLLVVIPVMLGIILNAYSQDTIAIFSKPGLDRGVHIHTTRDHHFIATGITTHPVSAMDGLVLNYSDDMNLLWSRAYGGGGVDFLWGVAETTQKGFVITGFTNSSGNGGFDGWVLKLDAKGDTVWTKTIGGAKDERIISVIQTTDGSFAMVGQTNSWGAGDQDVLLVKMTSKGETLWYKTIGETKSDRGFYLVETDNGDLIISGITENNSNNDVDALIIRASADGHVIWKKTYGGKGADVAHSLLLHNKQIVIGGYKEYAPGMHHPWVFRLDEQGNIINEDILQMDGDARIIGGFVNDDNEFIGTGYARQSESDDWDVLLVKCGSNKKNITKIYSMPLEDQGYGISEYKKGQAVVVGYSYSIRSKDGDLIIMRWSYD